MQQRLTARSVDDPALRQFLIDNDIAVGAWPIPAWDVDKLVMAALYFHPDLDAARARWQVERARQVTAGLRPAPTLGLLGEHHSETLPGQTPWSLGLFFEWLWERPQKREARLVRAGAEVERSRLQWLETAWRMRQDVRGAFLKLQSLQPSLDRQRRRTAIQKEVYAVLTRRGELGEADLFELSTAELQLQQARLDLEDTLIDARETELELAGRVGVSTPVNKLTYHVPEPEAQATVLDIDLQSLMLNNRVDIRAALQSYAIAESELRLAVENQYPDINLTPGFLFDQEDRVWTLGVSWLLPWFKNHQGPIGEAEARRELVATEFEALQWRALSELSQAINRCRLRLAAMAAAREVVEAARRRFNLVATQVEQGFADRLARLRSELTVVVAELVLAERRAQATQAFHALETTVGYPLDSAHWPPAALTGQPEQ